MKRFLIVSFVFVTSATPFTAVLAVENDGHSHAGNIRFSDNATPMTDGTIKKIDKDIAQLTIKHGELKNLHMPAMTMVFKVKNLSMLDQVSVGDHVSFIADSIDGKLVVTKLVLHE